MTSTTEALAYLQDEHDNNESLTSADKGKLQDCINSLENISSPYSKSQSLDILNDFYWDSSLRNRKDFGTAIYVVAYTVNPDAPYPKVRV